MLEILFLCHSVISFLLEFFGTPCDQPNSADKGIELAVGNWENDGYWIPLAYYHHDYSRREQIRIGDFTSRDLLTIRGYDVPAKQVEGSKFETLELCRPANNLSSLDGMQLRWLQTSRHPEDNTPPVDVWALDNVSVEVWSGGGRYQLMRDDFDSDQLK